MDGFISLKKIRVGISVLTLKKKVQLVSKVICKDWKTSTKADQVNFFDQKNIEVSI
jgi:hypothetical protein